VMGKEQSRDESTNYVVYARSGVGQGAWGVWCCSAVAMPGLYESVCIYIYTQVCQSELPCL
jgi:hypothetical protein